jgi:hypothetical protein
LYEKAARNWSALSYGRHGWQLDDLLQTYRVKIPYGGWAEELIITAADIKLIKTSVGLFSPAEYTLRYGTSLEDYLLRQQEQHANAAGLVLKALSGEVIARKLLVTLGDKLCQIVVNGPSGIPPNQWIMPVGTQFVDIVE